MLGDRIQHRNVYHQIDAREEQFKINQAINVTNEQYLQSAINRILLSPGTTDFVKKQNKLIFPNVS